MKPGHDIAPGRVDHLDAFVLAEARDVAVGDRDIRLVATRG